jgi:chromosome segregation ATPase
VKLKAIRLHEVGRFREPIALEGLSGGLDVLAGPNELGKSTIFKALRRALEFKYNSKHGELEKLRPYGGGAPLVELDFEIDGKTWRLRKRFLSSPVAELKELSSGRIARGADAETELAKLLKGSSETERLGLLWVDQGSALGVPPPSDKARSALLTTIESEVETVAEGGAARAVQACVEEELAAFLTKKAERPTGRYKEAIAERDKLRDELNVAQGRLERAQGRLERLQDVRDLVAKLADPQAAAERAKAAEGAARAFDEARNAREKCRQAEAALAAQDERCSALKAALEALDARIIDLGRQEEAAAREAPQLADLERSVAEGESRVGECRKRRDEIKAALNAAEEERKALVLAARLAEVREHLTKARTAAGEHKTLTEAIAANGADDVLLKAVRREAGSVATITARLSAAAPAVTVAYAPGGKGKIKIDGRALKDGERLNPTQAVVLDIEGVGTVTVAPGRSQGLAEAEADLAAHEKALAELLDRIGAATVEEAEQRAMQRHELQSKLAEAAADVKAHAPDGVVRLEQAEAQLAAQAELIKAKPERTSAELESQAHELADALAEAETQLSQLVTAHGEAREALVGLRARAENRRERIAKDLAELGSADARADKRKGQADALAAASTERNAAVRDHAAWRETAPDDDRFAALKRAAEAAEVKRVTAERELQELRQTEAKIEGELTADRDEDVESHVAELKETCALADARLADLENEIAALQLLSRELAALAQSTRDRFAKPVLDRLGPYIDLVFPDARAHLSDGFALSALERAGGVEALERLSHGTQEQLAVLVRLGFGRLLAARGAPVPLILDDALVYADDTRIERMFEALKLGAWHHQVLVLTCRERTFAGLEGNRVAIAAWRPD